MRPFVHILRPLAAVAAAWLIAGCNGPGQPTLRAGALPFPGLGLYVVADAENLGRHRYWSPFQFADGEVGRGVIYTRRAGFVDVAHVRDTADWTFYFATRVQAALQGGRATLTADGPDRSRLRLRFDYPPGWDALADDARQSLIRELALRAGQEAAYATSTWHELLTWYGHSTLPLISERHSAFTYDDVMGHVLGLRVAGRAWDDLEHDYEEATALALGDVLREAGATTPEQTRGAVAETEGWWWVRGSAIKRHLDVGLDDGRVRPMLLLEQFVAHDDESADAEFMLPRAADVTAAGMRFDRFLSLTLEPRLSLYDKTLRGRLPGRPARILPRRDIPLLMKFVRREMREEFGDAVDMLDDAPPPMPLHTRAE